MKNNYTLCYWFKFGWYVGRLREMPNIYCQAKTLSDLESKIKKIYKVNYEDDIMRVNSIKMGS
jgi:hypothetical protein